MIIHLSDVWYKIITIEKWTRGAKTVFWFSKGVEEHYHRLYTQTETAHGDSAFHFSHGCLSERYCIFHLAPAWHHWPLSEWVRDVIILPNEPSAHLACVYIHVFVLKMFNSDACLPLWRFGKIKMSYVKCCHYCDSASVNNNWLHPDRLTCTVRTHVKWKHTAPTLCGATGSDALCSWL